MRSHHLNSSACRTYYGSQRTRRIANIPWLLFLCREAMPQGAKIISGATTCREVPGHTPTLTLYLSHTLRWVASSKENQTQWWLRRTHPTWCRSNTQSLLYACSPPHGQTKQNTGRRPEAKTQSLQYVHWLVCMCETKKRERVSVPRGSPPCCLLVFKISDN